MPTTQFPYLKDSWLTNGDPLLVTAGYFAAIISGTNRKYLCLHLFSLSALCYVGENFFCAIVQFQQFRLNVIIFEKIAKAQRVFSDDLIVSHRGQIMKGRLCYSSWALIVLKATIVPGALQAPGDISCSDLSLDEVSHNHRHRLPHWLQPLYHSCATSHPTPLPPLACPKTRWKPQMISDSYITAKIN